MGGPGRSALHDHGAVRVDPSVGRRAADHRHHARGLAPVMGGVVEQRRGIEKPSVGNHERR